MYNAYLSLYILFIYIYNVTLHKKRKRYISRKNNPRLIKVNDKKN